MNALILGHNETSMGTGAQRKWTGPPVLMWNMKKNCNSLCDILLFQACVMRLDIKTFSPSGTERGVLAHLKPRENLRSVHTKLTYISEDISPQLWALTGDHTAVCNLDAPRTDMQEVLNLSQLKRLQWRAAHFHSAIKKKVDKSSLYLAKVRLIEDSDDQWNLSL